MLQDVSFIELLQRVTLKHGKPMAVIISNERYKRLLKQGIDVNEY